MTLLPSKEVPLNIRWIFVGISKNNPTEYSLSFRIHKMRGTFKLYSLEYPDGYIIASTGAEVGNFRWIQYYTKTTIAR